MKIVSWFLPLKDLFLFSTKATKILYNVPVAGKILASSSSQCSLLIPSLALAPTMNERFSFLQRHAYITSTWCGLWMLWLDIFVEFPNCLIGISPYSLQINSAVPDAQGLWDVPLWSGLRAQGLTAWCRKKVPSAHVCLTHPKPELPEDQGQDVSWRKINKI